MSDADRAPALRAFIADLNTAWKTAGPPSYTDLRKLSRQVRQSTHGAGLRVELAESTTQEILSGQRRGLPKWQWVASFLAVLRVAAAESDVNPDSLGTLEYWKARHEAADAELHEAKRMACEPAGAAAGIAQRPILARRTADQPVTSYDWELGSHTPTDLYRRALALGLWQDYRDAVPGWFETYLHLEPAASLIRTCETHFIPGLLQTEEYASAVIGLGHPGFPAAQVMRRVELRMRRQQILHRPNASRLWAVLDEAVLRRWPVARATMRTQLRYLIDICEQPNVTIQVMPFSAGSHTAAGGPISILRFPEREIPDVVYLEQLTTALYPSEPDDIHHYNQVLSRLGIEAASPAASVKILREVAEEA